MLVSFDGSIIFSSTFSCGISFVLPLLFLFFFFLISRSVSDFSSSTFGAEGAFSLEDAFTGSALPPVPESDGSKVLVSLTFVQTASSTACLLPLAFFLVLNEVSSNI
uniref:Uncharacterized protein n=1 Tax=Panstrongylus lignarius TaxID=156445 RepID=A0A224Y240_9HEMI